VVFNKFDTGVKGFSGGSQKKTFGCRLRSTGLASATT
jgi:hypothetical protein